MKTNTITVALSDARPVKINTEEWPLIARADEHDGQVECQANTVAKIKVRRHADGRTLVYGYTEAGGGGQYVGMRNPHAGYLIPSIYTVPSIPGSALREGAEDEGVRAIRRVAGAIGYDHLGSDVIADLPAEEI